MKAELANVLCWGRILITLFLCVIGGKAVWVPAIYSVAFISDAVDGYCWRHFTNGNPKAKVHWFNRLPLTMDPLADFIYGVGGLVYLYKVSHFWGYSAAAILIAGACIVLNLVALVLERGLARTIVVNVLTYGYYAVMVSTNFLVWRTNGNLVGFLVTMLIFYVILFSIGDRSRIVRR